MLVLRRQRDEEIVYIIPPSDQPTEIILKVVDIRGDQVRLGSSAPRTVIIDRREVHEAKVRDALPVT